jgi:UDP-2,3-diacylglucosamine hydrolase
LIQHESALFVSDLHLSETSAECLNRFSNFLDQYAANAQALFILGDLFEAWPGDDVLTILPQQFPVQHRALECLRLLERAGKTIYFTRGNRDFMVGEAFVRAIGPNAQLLTDPTVVQIAEVKTLISHGDLYCTDDIDYQKFRAMSRHPQWIAQALTMSLEQRLALANKLLQESGQAKQGKSAQIMDVNEQAIATGFALHDVRTMVHGHTHRPAHHVQPYGERYVLPDWEVGPASYRGGGLLATQHAWTELRL